MIHGMDGLSPSCLRRPKMLSSLHVGYAKTFSPTISNFQLPFEQGDTSEVRLAIKFVDQLSMLGLHEIRIDMHVLGQ